MERTLPLMTPVEYDRDLDLGDSISATFTRAGHILGSSSIRLDWAEASVLFSGDLGRRDHPVLRSVESPPPATYVVMESTYGDRQHPQPVNLPHEELADTIRRTVQRGGSVLVPAFAIDRTEIVLTVLADLIREERIPRVPIWVDSPMASAALRVYRDAGEELRPGLDPREFTELAGVQMTSGPDDSMRLTRGRHGPQIVVTSSGMAAGGRVVHHLAAMLPEARNSVVLTGYQGVGTRGRALLDGARQLKFHGQYVPVRAEIVQDSEFSVHADAADLVSWVGGLTPPPSTVFVTHGEQGSAESFASLLARTAGLTAVVPRHGEVVSLAPADQASAAQPSAPVASPAPAPASRTAVTFDGAAVVDGGELTGPVDADLHVVERHPDRIVLRGTLTVHLDDAAD